MTKEQAIAAAARKGPPNAAYLNKKSTHKKQVAVMVGEDEKPILDEKGNPKTTATWIPIPDAKEEYVVSKKKLEHYIGPVSVFVIGCILALAEYLISGSADGMVFAALTGTGVFENYAKNGLYDAGSDAFWPVDVNTDTMKMQGVTSTEEGTLLDTDSALDSVTTTERTHGPTTVVLALSEPTDNTARIDGTDLSGTFDDPNNGNGATSCLVLYKDGASDAQRPLIWWSVLASDVAQDGTDDDLTFNASGLWEMTF